MGASRFSDRSSIIIYSHDGFGLGHLSRTTYLARCIRRREPNTNILIVTSSAAAHRYSPLDDFEYIKLPSVTKIGVERYRPHNLTADLRSVIALRSELLLATVKRMRPDVLLVDHRPLGLRGEVLPTLAWIRDECPDTRTVVGLRDVVDEASKVRDDWLRQGVYDALENLYDHVLVYGDRAVFDMTEEYEIPRQISQKFLFTGYLGRTEVPIPRRAVREMLGLREERFIVVHAGGGGDGGPLIDAYLRSAERLPNGVFSLVVTGPLMDREERRRLCGAESTPRVRVVDYQEDLISYVAASDLTVSMGGYNTVCEVVSTGVRAIVVPRVSPRTEQHIRAQRFAALGLLEILHPNDLDPVTLAARVQSSLELPFPPVVPLQLNGGQWAADFLTSLLPKKRETHRDEEANLVKTAQ